MATVEDKRLDEVRVVTAEGERSVAATSSGGALLREASYGALLFMWGFWASSGVWVFLCGLLPQGWAGLSRDFGGKDRVRA